MIAAESAVPDLVRIETPRLLLRRWRSSDVAPLAAVQADPEVMRWIRDGSVRDEEETRAGIEVYEASWRERGFGLFAVEVRETGELAGFAGLAVPHFLPEVLPAVEIGWRLGREFWGRGLATEAARAALDFGFRECGLDRILSIVQEGNTASERVTQKLGMRLDRETVDPATGRATRIFAIDAPTAG
ncbi:GNAT family N-acetyltransferase [Streptomyces sp. NPDC090025]|uniref:GNAT family N-acetyltransferase n=1 Tax=Streptomyces sp. NPDC090025 TaxID=3365922 RepID=UPI003838C000